MTTSSIMPRPDPRAQIDARISAAASAGAIGSEDQAALSSALDAINTSLAADGAGSGRTVNMKEKVDGLIAGQVESGALTEDQAAELKSFFSQGSESGPQPGPPSAAPARAEGGTDSAATTQISAAAARQLDAMTAFLQKLRNAAASGSSVYGSNAGTTGNGSSATGWVIDTTA